MTLWLEGQLVSQVNYSVGQRSCLWCWTSVRWAPGSHLVVNKVKLLCRVPTLCDPMDCSLPSSSVHMIFQARVLEWVAIRSWLFSALLGSGGLKRPLSGVGRSACSWRETPESLGVQRALEEESGEGPSLILIFAVSGLLMKSRLLCGPLFSHQWS